LGYIPEEGWNDTVAGQGLSASGGGASLFFAKPYWQAGTGVPNDVVRHVPDVALSASPVNDGYLFCSATDTAGNPSCTSGFRDSGGFLDVVGGTSAGSPTFAAILALLNQYVGNTPPTGLAPVNASLYQIAATGGVFNDITTGNNKVPCTTGTPDCPSGTTSIGFSAGTGYDEVTGLGSVNAAALALAWVAPGFLMTPDLDTYNVRQGASATVTITPAAFGGFTGTVTYTCTDSAPESTCTGTTSADVTAPATFTITAKAPATAALHSSDRNAGIFYAFLLPGLMGVVFLTGKKNQRALQMLALIALLGLGTVGLQACGGGSSGGGGVKDPGTPVGQYNVTIKGTSGGVTVPVSVTLNVTP
jgi:subtilase family serine protease